MTPKDEALEALDVAIKMLEAPEPLSEVRKRLVSAALGHAWTKVVEMPDVTRRRRSRAALPPEPEP